MDDARETQLLREFQALLKAQGTVDGMIHSSQVQEAIYMLNATDDEKNIIANLIAGAVESGQLGAVPYTAN